jgi:hypothetical protein
MQVWPRQSFPWFVEDGVVENFQALSLLASTILLALLAWRKQWAPTLLVLTGCTLLLLLEEISWGQRIIGFQPPSTLKSFNRQGEFNLHNTNAFQKWRHGLLALSGLLGLALIFWRSRLSRVFPTVAPLFPPARFAPFFVVILLAAASLGFGWLEFDGEALDLPSSASGRILSESAEAFIIAVWLGLTIKAVRST